MDHLMEKLKAIAEKTAADCTFSLPCTYFGKEEIRPILLPSGDNKYKSFWVRDCAMMAESGLIKTENLRQYVEIIALHGQNGAEERKLANNLRIPPYAVADHINYDGVAVFYPGTYSSGENQGNGAFGFYPPFCDNFFFVILVDCYIRQSGDKEILTKEYNGMRLLDRLVKAVKCYQIDEDTELCCSDETFFTIDWGFTDTIRKTGLLLMSSLLRYRAAQIVASYFEDFRMKQNYFKDLEFVIRRSVLYKFYDKKTGWLYSATGLCKQHDVWATAYAGYIGLLQENKTLEALRAGYEQHTAVVHGYVRQILTTENAAADSAWACAYKPGFAYQNGGYWSTATGWYARTLSQKYPDLARKMLQDFVSHTEKYRDQGAPYEWTNEDTTAFSGCHYGTSGILPYTAFKDIGVGPLYVPASEFRALCGKYLNLVHFVDVYITNKGKVVAKVSRTDAADDDLTGGQENDVLK